MSVSVMMRIDKAFRLARDLFNISAYAEAGANRPGSHRKPPPQRKRETERGVVLAHKPPFSDSERQR